ncbi:MAG: quinate 5-dehydrogenase [Bacillota bacterium]
MKKILSISLGSSKRDHEVRTYILNEKFIIKRIGTDGDKKKAYKLFTKLDGKYDAFGLGGIDLYIHTARNRYVFRDARKLIKNVEKTPVVDGSGLKDTLERKVLFYLNNSQTENYFSGKKVLMVSAVDRLGMAETFKELGADLVIGDLVFGIGVPLVLRSFRSLELVARIIAPVITKLPFELIYPTGEKQEYNNNSNKFAKLYHRADIIAGDFHFINKYLPQNLPGKIIITNTVTEKNIKKLKNRNVKKIITTTPNFCGRSFGTNVMEAVLVSLMNKPLDELKPEDYFEMLEKINFTPGIIDLNS